MQIILVGNGLKAAKTVTLTGRHIALAVLALVLLVMALSSALSYVAASRSIIGNVPILKDFYLSLSRDQVQEKDAYLRENINTLAVRLGEMQAQMTRLDALGERVSGLAGVKPGEINFKAPPGRGGALPAISRELSMEDLTRQIDELSGKLDGQTDFLNLVESELMGRRVLTQKIPTRQPVLGYNGSGFGWRIDPITGRQTQHLGIDFQAPPGTPILAAAGGVVVAAEYHPMFGNMVDIDHGNNLLTRYAHASKMHVKPGQIVKLGDKIAEIGSTGRSTGPHLHFEVHVAGVPQDPMKFLRAGTDMAAAQAAASAALAVRPH
jgi:murein DD-endopeptidase MepM/ murein hydrolase activator NlpD